MLKALLLQNNSFTSFRQSAHNLRFLNVSDNEFNHLLPENIGWILPRLWYMNISKNGFQGNLPSSLGNMKSIVYMDLSHNSFHGKLPTSFVMGCYYLITLKLSHNKLCGEIFPRSINSTRVSVLAMDNNQFTGKIGQGLRSFTELSLLDISNNNLTGVIPRWIGELPPWNMQYCFQTIRWKVKYKSLLMLDPFNMDYKADTQIRVEFATKHRYDTYMGGNLELLFGLDLSENKLSSEIPVELGGLLKLQALNLSHNNLSGVIPKSFSGLKNVESLDLSFNRLRGQIPQQLTELSSLAVFNVSFNNLSGVIPQGKQFNTFDTHSYLGNHLLCGQPTSKSCNCNNIGFHESDDGVEHELVWCQTP